MGSFNATCIVSNLAIEAGERVRYLALVRSAFEPDGNGHCCYVGGRWQLHGVPIKAQYNDYGSIEGLEDSLQTSLFFEALKRSAIEQGVGDNQCHDVAVRAEMSREDWLTALWEGRIFVEGERPYTGSYDPEAYEPKPGVPSVRRLSKVITDAGLTVVTSYMADGYVVDQVAPGFIRIRYGERVERGSSAKLKQLLPTIHAAKYAAMVTVGTGDYPHGSEILVAPLPPTDPNVHISLGGLAPEPHMRPRPVSQAMIREDVWQILLNTPYKSWRGVVTADHMRNAGLQALEHELTYRAKLTAEIDRMAQHPGAQSVAAEIEDLKETLSYSHDGRDNPFLASLPGHEGHFGFSLKDAYRLAIEQATTPHSDEAARIQAGLDLKAFVIELADTVYMQRNFAALHGQWHPSTNGDQEGRWAEHRAFLLKLAQIKGRYEEDEEEDEDEDDGTEDQIS
jgi:hypothetical protein